MFEILNELNFLSFFLCLHCASHFYAENAIMHEKKISIGKSLRCYQVKNYKTCYCLLKLAFSIIKTRQKHLRNIFYVHN